MPYLPGLPRQVANIIGFQSMPRPRYRSFSATLLVSCDRALPFCVFAYDKPRLALSYWMASIPCWRVFHGWKHHSRFDCPECQRLCMAQLARNPAHDRDYIIRGHLQHGFGSSTTTSRRCRFDPSFGWNLCNHYTSLGHGSSCNGANCTAGFHQFWRLVEYRIVSNGRLDDTIECAYWV